MGIVKKLSEAGFRIKYLTLRNNQLSLQYLHMKGNKLEFKTCLELSKKLQQVLLTNLTPAREGTR